MNDRKATPVSSFRCVRMNMGVGTTTLGCSGNECSVGLTLVTTTARLLVISGSFLAGGQGAGGKGAIYR